MSHPERRLDHHQGNTTSRLQGRTRREGQDLLVPERRRRRGEVGHHRDEADEWLHRFPDDAHVMACIGRPGWNDLDFGGAISEEELLEAVEEFYRLVVWKLPRQVRPEE